MTPRVIVCALIVALLSGDGRVDRLRASDVRSVLPSSANAKTLLNATTRHREWVTLPTGGSYALAFVVYPERAERAPVVLVTARGDSADVRSRAIEIGRAHV